MRVITEQFLKENNYSLEKCIEHSRRLSPSFQKAFYDDVIEYGETASSISTANRCGALYGFKYKYGLFKEGQTSVNLAVGSLTHVGLEYYWNMISSIVDRGGEDTFAANSGGILECLDNATQSIDPEFWDDEKSEVWKCHVGAYLHGYYDHNFQKDINAGYHDIRPEFSFIYISDNGRLRLGKMDVLMLKGDDEAICMEHKTTDNKGALDFSTPYWTKLDIDTQLCFYREAVEKMYPNRKATVIYDVIIKTSKKPLKGRATRRKGETDEELEARKREKDESIRDFNIRVLEEYLSYPEERLVRREVPALGAHSKTFSREVDFTFELLHDQRFLQKRNPTACTYFGRPCDFLDVCTGRADTSTGFKEKQSKHIEIEEMNSL